MLIDTHCHLNDRRAFPDPEATVREAQAAGVDRLVVIGIDTRTSDECRVLAERFDNVWFVAGWHPNHASDFTEAELEPIRHLAHHEKCLAIGEIGLDYYRDHASRDEQFRALTAQLDLADELGMPVVFHCRDAYDDLLNVLEKRPRAKWLFHCFAGTLDDARRAIALDCVFGVDGPVTYKSADALRSTLVEIGLDRLVVETDAPYMAPVPYRGQQNRPAYVVEVARKLAEMFDVTEEEVNRRTSENAIRFFGDKLGV